jgi:hypothetical protein
MTGTKVYTCTKTLHGPGHSMRLIGQGAVTETPLSGVLTRVGSQLNHVSTWLHEDSVGKGAAMWADHADGPLYRTARGRHVGFDRVNQHLPCLLTQRSCKNAGRTSLRSLRAHQGTNNMNLGGAGIVISPTPASWHSTSAYSPLVVCLLGAVQMSVPPPVPLDCQRCGVETPPCLGTAALCGVGVGAGSGPSHTLPL